VRGRLPGLEAHLVPGEQDVVVPEESFGEDIGECVIFFVEVEDACIGCACCAPSATCNRGQFRIMTAYGCQASSQPSFHRLAGGKTRNCIQVSDCKYE
jgi:hypothetical protein